jgi:transcriptional regulator
MAVGGRQWVDGVEVRTNVEDTVSPRWSSRDPASPDHSIRIDVMCDLPYYKDPDPNLIWGFIAEHPFALLTGCDAQARPVATQAPVFVEEEEGLSVLRGHIMRSTDHNRAFAQNSNVLVVFTSPHAYVSGTWYSDSHIASTWNYMSVHVRGAVRFLDDGALVDVLRRTSLHFEGGNRDSPTVFDNLPDTLKDKYLRAIIAFEIEILETDHVFKLSQDRDEASHQNIIRELEQRNVGARFIASEMRKRSSKPPPGGGD